MENAVSTNSFFGKFLRFTAIVLTGLTSGFTLLGGIGTTCLALAPTRYVSMKSLASFQWLYILFVLPGVALGVWVIGATIMLIKGSEKAYGNALTVLIAGAVIGVIHMAVSRMLRGKSMPVDAVVYTTVLTLIYFLNLRIPALWQRVDFSKENTKSNRPAGVVSAIMFGLLAFTIQYTMQSTHTWDGINYAAAFNVLIFSVGVAFIICGAWIWKGESALKFT
jgi:hypothetical protein